MTIQLLGQCCPLGGSGANPLVGLAFVALAFGIWQAVRWTVVTWNMKGITAMSRIEKITLVAAMVAAMGAVVGGILKAGEDGDGGAATVAQTSGKPRLLDLGSKTCIPCQMMAPILEELRESYAGQFEVEFIDVGLRENAPAVKKYGIKIIPTQIFFDGQGRELWRHEGFLGKEEILGKWQELGYEFRGGELPAIERWEPAARDERPAEQICYMCDGEVNPRTAVVVNSDKGEVRLCGPHCYFIMYSCLTEDTAGFERKVSATDFAAGERIPALEAVYLSGVEERSGRPWVWAFATRAAALEEMKSSGGSIVRWAALRENELSHRCGFCDRACYPQDAAKVLIEGLHSYGCCSHCALGVAARTGKDIEVHQPDRLTGEMIVVGTVDGQVAAMEPSTAVAWFGKKQKDNGTWASAGCFHQGFFATPENLQKWLDENPLETGEMISIAQALSDKMKLSPGQISKACKIGECAPK